MKIVVFSGPSLRDADRQDFSEFTHLPPVSQGDVYRCLARRPDLIAIVDGYFDGSPAVWHKEILFALSQSVSVWGAASMGALRAAELHQFGMRGVGRIFESFRDGLLTDDDEVALSHGPGDIGYLNLSVPMVDIRATVEAAENSSVIDPDLAERLLSVAKQLYYPRRNWEAILQKVRAGGEERGRPFEEWLPGGQVSQKRQDALALLGALRGLRSADASEKVHFRLECTEMWERGCVAFRQARLDEYAEKPGSRLVIEKLEAEPERYSELCQLASMLILSSQTMFEPAARINNRTEFRMRRELFSAKSLEQWREANDLSEEEYEKLADAEAALRRVMSEMSSAHEEALIDACKLSGDYARLARRANDDAAGKIGLLNAQLPEIGQLNSDLVETLMSPVKSQRDRMHVPMIVS